MFTSRKNHNRTHDNRRFLAATLAGTALLVGSACGSTETTSSSSPSVSVAPEPTSPVVDTTPVDTTPEVVVTDPALATSEPEPVATPAPEPEPAEPEPEPTPEPEPAPIEPEPEPEPAPEDDDGWDGACGPNDPMPAGAEYISMTTVQFGDGVENTATAYVYDGVWKLRIDGPVVSDEMILDAPESGIVKVLTAAPVNDFGGDEILVKLDSIADLSVLGIFGQHDGCIFRHTDADLEPVSLTVGVHDGALFGVTCSTDEFGSFITSRSAVSNDDDTWNIYGTSYTYDSPTKLQAGDGGHQFAVPTDDPVIASFANVECGDLLPGQF